MYPSKKNILPHEKRPGLIPGHRHRVQQLFLLDPQRLMDLDCVLDRTVFLVEILDARDLADIRRLAVFGDESEGKRIFLFSFCHIFDPLKKIVKRFKSPHVIIHHDPLDCSESLRVRSGTHAILLHLNISFKNCGRIRET